MAKTKSVSSASAVSSSIHTQVANVQREGHCLELILNLSRNRPKTLLLLYILYTYQPIFFTPSFSLSPLFSISKGGERRRSFQFPSLHFPELPSSRERARLCRQGRTRESNRKPPSLFLPPFHTTYSSSSSSSSFCGQISDTQYKRMNDESKTRVVQQQRPKCLVDVV